MRRPPPLELNQAFDLGKKYFEDLPKKSSWAKKSFGVAGDMFCWAQKAGWWILVHVARVRIHNGLEFVLADPPPEKNNVKGYFVEDLKQVLLGPETIKRLQAPSDSQWGP